MIATAQEQTREPVPGPAQQLAVAPNSTLVELLAGFDQTRLEHLAINPDADELARLIYRMKRIDPGVIRQRAIQDDKPPQISLGQVVSIGGVVESFSKLAISPRLREPLAMDAVYQISLTLDSQSSSDQILTRLFVDTIPRQFTIGDRVTAHAMALTDAKAPGGLERTGESAADQVAAFAAATLQWKPEEISSIGHAILADAGFELSLIDSIAARDRKPLSGDDTDSFYAMMAAADLSKGSSKAQAETDVIQLLVNAEQLVGEVVRLKLDVVSVTRISIQNDRRKKSFGRDHYFQCDALATLADSEVVIRRPGGKPVDDIKVGNRFPISIVSKSTPPGVGDDVVTSIGQEMLVEGFLYRTWSYQNDLTKQSGLRQYAPLICAKKLTLLEKKIGGAADVRWIGVVAATLFIIGTMAAAAIVWRWSTLDRGAGRSRWPSKIDDTF